MSYNSVESSAFSGNPVEIYHFYGGAMNWYFTSADEDLTVGGIVYVSTQIQRDTVSETQEMNQLPISVDLPTDNPIAVMFGFYPPTAVIELDIRRYHRSDGNAILFWTGRVLNSEYKGVTTSLHCEPASTSVKRLGLRRYYQRQCPHILYGPACGLNKSDYKTTATVMGHTGLMVTLNQAFAENAYAGGMLSWETAFGTQWRFIYANSNSTPTLQVNLPFMGDDDDYHRGLPVGTVVSIYPGCQHTMTDCVARFNNINNYGGFPYIPMSNPFNGTTLGF